LGKAVEVDQDIDSVGVDELRRIPVRGFGDIDKAVEGGGEASADRTSIVRTR
jgi:hypothetical protein